MLKYFSISAKSSSAAISALMINLLYYTIFEVVFIAAVNRLGLWSYLSAYPLWNTIAEGIIAAQAIVLFAVNLYLSFRQKGVMLYDEYMHIQDGLLPFRLFYRRKIKYEDIKFCQVRRRKDLNIARYYRVHRHSAANPIGFMLTHFFVSFSCFEPFMGFTNSPFVVEIITYNHKHIILDIEKPEEFVIAVNGEDEEDTAQ